MDKIQMAEEKDRLMNLGYGQVDDGSDEYFHMLIKSKLKNKMYDIVVMDIDHGKRVFEMSKHEITKAYNSLKLDSKEESPMMENKYGLLMDNEKVVIETDCEQDLFEKVVVMVKENGVDYNVDQVVEIIRMLGYKAEYLDKSTNKDFHF
jgi:hypothetical protein